MLERSLDLIERIARAEGPLTQARLAEDTGLPRPTVSRLVRKLAADGYLVHEPGGRLITIGPKLLRLGLDVMAHSGTASGRHRILEGVVEAIGETCNFTMLAGADVLYLDRVETRWPLRSTLDVGSRVPVHCTASGKLFLAAMTPQARRQLLRHAELIAHTPATLTTADALEQELAVIRRQGYSTDNEEFMAGLAAVAVPVKNTRGETVAALACHAPVARLPLAAMLAHLPALKKASAQLTRTLP